MKLKFVAILIPISIFIIIFLNIDISLFVDNLKNIDLYFFIPALLYFFIYPIIGIERWRLMINTKYDLDFKTAFRIYFIGETLNLILPSKAGDLSKAYFVKKFKGYSASYATSTVVFEKILDLMAISTLFLIGFSLAKTSFDFLNIIFGFIIFITIVFLVFLYFDKIKIIKNMVYKLNKKKLINIYEDISEFLKSIREKKILLLSIVLISLLFWGGHLFQIYMFFQSANVEIPYIQVIYYMPIAIIVSLVPITVGGLGTRDATLLFLLSSIYPTESIVLAGLLISLRYFIPGILGMFFIGNYKKYADELKKKND